MAEDDISNDFKQVRISRLTLGLIMTVASISGIVVWNAAAVSNKINTLSIDIVQLQEDMEDIGEPTVVLSRLDSIERTLEDIDLKGFETRLSTIETWAYVELTERLEKVEQFIDELDRNSGEEIRNELDDMHYHKDAFRDILNQDPRDFVKEIMNQRFSW
jgi:hypothetical protein